MHLIKYDTRVLGSTASVILFLFNYNMVQLGVIFPIYFCPSKRNSKVFCFSIRAFTVSFKYALVIFLFSAGSPGSRDPTTGLVRPKRRPYSKLQLMHLEQEFQQSMYPCRERRAWLSQVLSLSERQVSFDVVS